MIHTAFVALGESPRESHGGRRHAGEKGSQSGFELVLTDARGHKGRGGIQSAVRVRLPCVVSWLVPAVGCARFTTGAVVFVIGVVQVGYKDFSV